MGGKELGIDVRPGRAVGLQHPVLDRLDALAVRRLHLFSCKRQLGKVVELHEGPLALLLVGVYPHVAGDDDKQGGDRSDGAVNFGAGLFGPGDGLELVGVVRSVGQDPNVDVVVDEYGPRLGVVAAHARLSVKVKAVFKKYVFEDDGFAHRALAADGQGKHVVPPGPVADQKRPRVQHKAVEQRELSEHDLVCRLVRDVGRLDPGAEALAVVEAKGLEVLPGQTNVTKRRNVLGRVVLVEVIFQDAAQLVAQHDGGAVQALAGQLLETLLVVLAVLVVEVAELDVELLPDGLENPQQVLVDRLVLFAENVAPVCCCHGCC